MFKKISFLLLFSLSISSVAVAGNNSQKKSGVEGIDKHSSQTNNIEVAIDKQNKQRVIAKFEPSHKELVDEVWQIINHQFIDPDFNGVDWLAVRKDYLSRSYSDSPATYAAIKEMLALLKDPLTRFMTPDEFKALRTNSDSVGIGLTTSKDEKTDRLIVISPVEDSPAFEAGILPQDIIYKIDGKDTKGMDVNDAVKLIRGERGSQVTLTIERNGKQSDYNIIRERTEIHPVRASVRDTEIGTIGYIRLTTFNEHAAKDMEKAIKSQEQEGVAGYVLDLRSNSGGLLYSSINIARMWINEGTIVSTVNRKGISDRDSAINKALTDKPLVVLVDEDTASGSEILTAALQENNRATIVGETTQGHSSIQSVRPLSDGSGLAITIAKFSTPNGNEIQDRGVQPDFKVEPTESEIIKLRRNSSLFATEEDSMWMEAVKILQPEL